MNSFEVKRSADGWGTADGKVLAVSGLPEDAGDTATVIVRPETMRFVPGWFARR